MATKPKRKSGHVTKSPDAMKVATITPVDKNAQASSLFERLQSPSTPEPHPEEPVSGLDKEVTGMFNQASEHRDKLVKFFIVYTWVFSGFVALIIVGQAIVRGAFPGKEDIELVPYWALNLLVVGLIGQFITLLTIVTRKVWLFEEFFKHADSYHNPKAAGPINKGEEENTKK